MASGPSKRERSVSGKTIGVYGAEGNDYLSDLADRVRAGDQAAAEELHRLALPTADAKSPRANTFAGRARKLSNELLGTNLPDFESWGGWDVIGNGLMAGAGAAIAAPVLGALAGGGGAASGAVGYTPTAVVEGAGAAGAAGGAGTAGALGGASGLLGGIKKYGPLVLGGLGAIDAAGQYNRAEGLQNQAIQMAKQNWQERAPLRGAFSERALAPLPTKTDESALFQASAGNPYARRG